MKVAIIGTGNMGSAIATALLQKKHSVVVYNRTRSKAEALQSSGAQVASSAADAIKQADATLIVLLEGGAVHSILHSDGMKDALRGRRILNVSHTRPDEIRSLGEYVQSAGGHLAEVSIPTLKDFVSTGQSQALLAGTAEEIEYWTALLKEFCSHIFPVGSLGHASEIELAATYGMMFNLVGSAYAMHTLTERGVPLSGLEGIWGNTPGFVNSLGSYMLFRAAQGSFSPPSWSISNSLITCDAILAELKPLHLPEGPMREVREVFARAVTKGLGDLDMAALYKGVDDR